MEAEGSGSSGLSSPLILPPPTVADAPPPTPVNTGRAEGDQLDYSGSKQISNSAVNTGRGEGGRLDSSITEITSYAGNPENPPESKEESNESHPWIIPVLFLGFYAIFGITTHQLSCRPEDSTCSLVDSIYFTVVTLCTTGYGDIVPQSWLTKIMAIFLLLAGFGVIDIWLNNGLFQFIFDWIESVLVKMKWISIEEGEAATTRPNMWVSLGIVACFIVIGTIAILCFEGLDLVDSIYLSVASVTTVGYGDFSFKTFGGRLFAIVWLSLSTSAVSRAVSCISAYSSSENVKSIRNIVKKNVKSIRNIVKKNVQSIRNIVKKNVQTAAKEKFLENGTDSKS